MNRDYLPTLRLCYLVVLLLTALTKPLLSGAETRTGADVPAIAIIIDDLGNSYSRDKQAVLLPGKLSYAILPHTPYARALANLAYSLHKDVLLHLPMQATDAKALGPGALTMDMDARQVRQTFFSSLASVPHAIGINNHMGSLLTQHPGHMQWLMEAIDKVGGLFFIDSFTAPKSIAYKIATENWIPNKKRDVFLDSVHTGPAVHKQFLRLLNIARKKGIALAIGHPYPETLRALETLLPTLAERGIQLVPVSELVNLQSQRIQTWRAYLSH